VRILNANSTDIGLVVTVWHTKIRSLILDLVAAACLILSAGTAVAASLSPQQAQSLPLLMSWLEGHFDNSAQLVDEDNETTESGAGHGRIDLVFKRIDLPEFGEFTFYSQQYNGGDPARVFRQAIYSIEPDDDGRRLNMTIHILTQGERYLDAHLDPSKLNQLGHEDVTTLKPECVFRWEKRVGQFHGEIEKGACQIVSPRSGNKLTLLDEFYLADGALWFKDHGTDHEGNFAYGNIKGIPYKLRKHSNTPHERDYSGAVFKRSNVLVSDLDRSLELFEGILGFTVSSRAKTIDGSYIYDLFQLPTEADLHFALLSAGPEQQRTIALVEVTNADIPMRTPPYTASMVLGVSDLTDKIAAVSAMGLTTMRSNVGNGGGGSKLVEQAFVDFDGNVILLYEWLASPSVGD
jgi:catechol 2,3-dioxygenase-like lactoylglutathione lyase family enzyme